MTLITSCLIDVFPRLKRRLSESMWHDTDLDKLYSIF